jgi:hypothetical protein
LKKKRKAKLLTGYTLHLQTYDDLGQLAISYIGQSHESIKGIKLDLLEIYSILIKIQTIFPNLFITSNRAEQFNSVHDRQLSYRGRTTSEKANKRLNLGFFTNIIKKGLRDF